MQSRGGNTADGVLQLQGGGQKWMTNHPISDLEFGVCVCLPLPLPLSLSLSLGLLYGIYADVCDYNGAQ